MNLKVISISIIVFFPCFIGFSCNSRDEINIQRRGIFNDQGKMFGEIITEAIKISNNTSVVKETFKWGGESSTTYFKKKENNDVWEGYIDEKSDTFFYPKYMVSWADSLLASSA